MYGLAQAGSEITWAGTHDLGISGNCYNAGCYNWFEQAAGLKDGGYLLK